MDPVLGPTDPSVALEGWNNCVTSSRGRRERWGMGAGPAAAAGGVSLREIKARLLAYKRCGRLDRVRLLVLTNCTFDGIVYNVARVMEECLACRNSPSGQSAFLCLYGVVTARHFFTFLGIFCALFNFSKKTCIFAHFF